MKLATIIIVILALSSCTTLKPIDASPEQLREQILAGKVIEPGDYIGVASVDGQYRKLKVVTVTDERVIGRESSVLIADIVAVEKLKFSAGKTAVLTIGGTYLTLLAVGLGLLVVALM